MQQDLNILILGKSDREKALARHLVRSPRCKSLFTQIGGLPSTKKIEINASNSEAIAAFCAENDIDILIPGSERLILGGIRNYIESSPAASKVKVIAPLSEAALLEGSKEFAKEFMAEEGIPTPRFMPVDSETLPEGISFLESLPGPYVIKADGLADGEGVFITPSLDEAKDILNDMIHGLLGEASEKVLIEEFVKGRECTVIIATDGEEYLILPPARDYKRMYDGDSGPNTRGMGAYSPVEFADSAFMEKVRKRIINPTLRGLKTRDIPYSGFLYFGLMEIDGEPILIEYNVRLGDPETQAILPRIESDFVEVLEGIADSTIGEKCLRISPMAAAAIVIIERRSRRRLISVGGQGATPSEAALRAYTEIDNMVRSDAKSGDEIHFRKDIAANE